MENEPNSKQNLSSKAQKIQNEAQNAYNEEAKKYQDLYNSSGCGRKIYRNGYHTRRMLCPMGNDDPVWIQLEFVEFRYANTNETFTFYGKKYFPYIPYSRDLISAMLLEEKSNLEKGQHNNLVSRKIISRLEDNDIPRPRRQAPPVPETDSSKETIPGS